MAEGGGEEPGGGLGQGEGLVLEGLPDAPQAAVDGGADSDPYFMIGTNHIDIVG